MNNIKIMSKFYFKTDEHKKFCEGPVSHQMYGRFIDNNIKISI